MIGDSYISYERLELMYNPLPDKLSEGDDLDEADEDPEEMGEEFDKIYAYVDKKTGRVSDAVSIRNGKKTPRSENPNNGCPIAGEIPHWDATVSYTHLDVYKRQPLKGRLLSRKRSSRRLR